MPRAAKTLGSLKPRAKDQRESAAKRGYDARWRKAKAMHLAKHPLCPHCYELDGAITTATDVDHKVPCKPDNPRFWDSSNWQSLCHSCHSRKTAKEDGAFGRKKKERKQ